MGEKDKYKEPTTPEEVKLVKIWQEVLSLERVGIHDNFFELGGNSLLVIKLVSYIEKIFGKNISVADVFKYQTISELSKHLIIKKEKNKIFDIINNNSFKKKEER